MPKEYPLIFRMCLITVLIEVYRSEWMDENCSTQIVCPNGTVNLYFIVLTIYLMYFYHWTNRSRMHSLGEYKRYNNEV